MKDKWPARIGLLLILTGAVCLLGCSGAAPSSTGTNTGNAPATVAYAFDYPYGQLNEYSTVPGDNGSLVGTLTLPAPYLAQQFATDLNGKIYVAACGPTNPTGEVFVFPPNSTGTAVPSNTIQIGSCDGGVSDIVALAVDPAGQYLYVETPAPADSPKTVSVYPAAASGAPVPVRTLQLPMGISGLGAADVNGNIFVGGSTSSCNGVVNVYGPDATGSDAPTRTITFENAQPDGLAVDANGDIFANVANCEGTAWAIEEFAPGAAGSASPINTINLPPFPVGIIGTDGLVQVDAASNIFASQVIFSQPSWTAVIYGFGSTATGQTAPTVTISYDAPASNFALN